MERVLDGIALAGLAAVAMFALSEEWQSLGAISAVMVYVTWFFVAGCLFLFYLAIRRPDVMKRIADRIARFFTRKWEPIKVQKTLERIDLEIANFHAAVLRFVRTAKSGLIWGMVFTVLYWVSEIVTASLILMGLGQPPLFFESFVIQLILAILMMLPLTPGSFRNRRGRGYLDVCLVHSWCNSRCIRCCLAGCAVLLQYCPWHYLKSHYSEA